MTDSQIFILYGPEQNERLQKVLQEGARRMLAVTDFIKQRGPFIKTDEGDGGG